MTSTAVDIKYASIVKVQEVAQIYNKAVEDLINNSDCTGPGFTASEALVRLNTAYQDVYDLLNGKETK